MSDARGNIQALHQLTGFEIRLDMAREHEWFTWIKCGFTSQDLRQMVAHLRREIREGRRNPGCLKFRNLICNPDFFEEDLAELRARFRHVKTPPQKAAVLRATGRDVAPLTSARSSGQILAEAKAFEEFRKFREAL